MPSAFTHAFVGAALTPLAPLPDRGARLAIELAVVSMLPDLDVIAFAFGIPYAHPLGHRGLSHALPFAAGLALLVPLVLHRDAPPGSRRWWALVGLFFAAGASHGLLDVCTDGGLGIGLLIPFSNTRFFSPWRPLAVSPIGVGAFFGEWGLRVLRSELLWVWLPVGALSAALILVRRQRGHR